MAEGGVWPKSRHECTICLEAYKQPKLLPCYHTFCVNCLDEYVEKTKKGNKFECPLCRKETEIPNMGVTDFLTNFYIDTEDVKEEEISCEGCDDKTTANHRCLDCDEYFCDRCTMSHMKMKVSKHHKMMELTTTDPSIKQKIKSRVFCKKHPNKEIEVVCKQCNQLLCLLCMVTDHHGHKSREVTEEAMEVRQNLNATVEKECIKHKLTKQKKTISGLKEANTRLKTSLDHEIKVIHNQGARLHRAVDTTIRQMKENLKKEYQKSMDKNEAQMKVSETFLLSLQSLATTARHVVEKATDFEMIETGKTLRAQLLTEIGQDPTKETDVERQDYGDIFTAGHVDVSALQKMIGSVTGHTKKQVPVQPRPPIAPINDRLVKISSFVTGNGRRKVGGIAPITDGGAWLCFYDNDLELIGSTGKSLLSLDVDAQIYSVTSDEADNCIISCSGKCIKHVTTTGKIETIVHRTDGDPYAVAYRRTSDDDEEIIFSCNNTSSGGSAVFVAPYHIGATPRKWAFGYNLIFHLAVDSIEKKVCIADNSNWSVIILDEKGLILSKLRSKKYESYGVTFDLQGGIVVTESRSSRQLQRINPDGTFIETLTNVTGCTVAMDPKGRLWVGKGAGIVEIYQMK